LRIALIVGTRSTDPIGSDTVRQIRCRHDVQASQGLHWRTPPNSLNLRDFLRHSQGRLGYRTAWMIKAKVSATQELQVNIDSHECRRCASASQRRLQCNISTVSSKRTMSDNLVSSQTR
jgi:hypothetical protein